MYLNDNQLTSVPAEIWQLTSLRSWTSAKSADERAGGDRAAHVADGVVPHGNQLTSVPAEIWQLTSLRELYLNDNKLMCVPAAIRELRAAGCRVYLDDAVTYDIRSYMHAHG